MIVISILIKEIYYLNVNTWLKEIPCLLNKKAQLLFFVKQN